jgi:type IV pilus assembly protein PilB
MSDALCSCHLLDGSVIHGTLLNLDLEQRCALLTRAESAAQETVAFDQISHLYHNRPHPAGEQRPFTLQFANGAELRSHCLAATSDLLGHHLYHVGQPATTTHLFLPAETPHLLTLERRHRSLEAQEGQTIALVDELIEQAIAERASDIHLRPLQEKVEVKFRIDGEMVLVRHLNPTHYPALVSRIKILADMDIAEHRKPQDGAHRLSIEGREVDLRISTVVVVEGESVAIRILDPRTGLRTLSQIGFRSADEARFRQMLEQKSGLILVTGPTGSGKSTTLYAAMRMLRERELNIISLEDPVEYRIDKVRQIEIHDAAGSSFAKNLRHILRHDPDVILIGEIRDEETAHIALQSAYTGHLVLSTLHTGDAPSAIPRLLEMGIEPYTLKDTLLGVLSQRLVRRRCDHCHGAAAAVAHCSHCHQRGYHGRMPLYELMPVDEGLRELIQAGITAQQIRRHATQSGMISMQSYAATLVSEPAPPIEMTKEPLHEPS